jgi:hypothetical protein
MSYRLHAVASGVHIDMVAKRNPLQEHPAAALPQVLQLGQLMKVSVIIPVYNERAFIE